MNYFKLTLDYTGIGFSLSARLTILDNYGFLEIHSEYTANPRDPIALNLTVSSLQSLKTILFKLSPTWDWHIVGT